VHLVLFHYYTKIGAKQAELMQLCKSSCHEMALEFFATNAPNPDHWTLNSYFVANLTGGNGGRRAEMARRHRGDGRSGVMAPGLGHDSEAEAARVWEQEGARQESRTAWSEG